MLDTDEDNGVDATHIRELISEHILFCFVSYTFEIKAYMIFQV